MSIEDPHSNIRDWLETATSGLPVPIAATVRNELEAHYWDAVDSYHEASPGEAEQMALADLGDPILTSKSLQNAHFSLKRCYLSTLTCLLYPAALFCLPLLARYLDMYQVNLFLTVSTTLIILYILYSFKSLLHTSVQSIDRPTWVLSTGQILWALTIVASYLLYRKLPLMGPNETLIWDFSSFGTALMDIGMLVAEAVTGVGALWMGILLLRESPLGSRLIRSIGWLLSIVGGISLFGSLMIVLGWAVVAGFTSALGYLSVTITLEVMAYFFLISATRSKPPLQLV